MDIQKLLAIRVKTLRETARLTQEQLAERAGLNPTYLGAVERGERNISIKNLEKIAVAFGITVPALLTLEETPDDIAQILHRLSGKIAPGFIIRMLSLLESIHESRSDPD